MDNFYTNLVVELLTFYEAIHNRLLQAMLSI